MKIVEVFNGLFPYIGDHVSRYTMVYRSDSLTSVCLEDGWFYNKPLLNFCRVTFIAW